MGIQRNNTFLWNEIVTLNLCVCSMNIKHIFKHPHVQTFLSVCFCNNKIVKTTKMAINCGIKSAYLHDTI